MKKLTTLTCIAVLAALGGAHAVAEETALPAKMSADDMSGTLFEREDTTRTEHNGHPVLDVTSLLSSDGKFGSGLYRAGPSRFEIDEPYGVDEFMYFLEGGVILTSADGSVMEVNAGEAVTLPKEWTGVWETDGYTKIWVIYSEDGSGLQ